MTGYYPRWAELSGLVERAISERKGKKKFSNLTYYFVDFFLGSAKAEAVAEVIRDHGYLARVVAKPDNSVWYVYVRRK